MTMPQFPAHEVLLRARSFLFVPGDQPGRFERTPVQRQRRGVADLEDAVAPAAKETVTDHTAELLTRNPGVVVRINDPRTPRGYADLASCAFIPTRHRSSTKRWPLRTRSWPGPGKFSRRPLSTISGLVDGCMVDRPVYLRARSIAARAGAATS